MKTYKHEGKTLTITAAAALSSGDGVLIGTLLGVAVADIAQDAQGAALIDGCVELPATTADAWAQGDQLYWDAANGKLTDVIGDPAKPACGRAAAAKAADATVATVLLNV